MKQIILTLFLVMLGAQGVYAQDYEVKPLSVNQSNSSEIAPFIVDTTLCFVSNRRNSAFVAFLNQDLDLLYRWYSAPINADGSLGNSSPYLPNLQGNWQNGPFVLLNNGKTLYATQNRKSISGSATNPMTLYAYHLSNGSWTEGDELFQNTVSGSVGQPTVSADGRYLVFVTANIPGNGKSDLFVCERQGEKWGEPVNLGPVINTKGNEVFPSFHTSGKLFFASDGHGGLGGLDVYYTINENGIWQNPVALPAPINSPSNDFGLALMPNGNNGFFASNRNGSDDLFSLKKLWPTFDVCEPQVEDNYCFTLFEDGLDQTDTLPIAYRWDFGDGLSAKGKEVDHCFPGPGVYHVTLNAVDTLLKVDMRTVADYELELVKTEQVFISVADTVKVGTEQVFSADKSYITTFAPGVYYWDLGDGTQAKGLQVSHAYKLPGVYVVKCGTVSDSDPTLKFCSSLEVIVVDQ